MVRTLTKSALLAIMAAGLVSQGTLTAAEAPQEEESAAVLDELSLGDLLTMKITTGSFLELDLKKSPLSMTVISNDMVRASGARNMSELLDIYVPGFIYNINKWNGTLWSLRGVANDRNTKIIYLVNGHKMNTQSRDGFQSETVLGLLGDIERVEVLRGPAGLVYGTGAIAGIINVVTKKAEGNSSKVTMSGSTDNSKSIEANLYGQPADDQKISASAGFRESDGLPYGETRLYGTAGWPGAPGFRQGGPSEGRYGSTDGNWKVGLDYTIDKFNLYARATRQKENGAAYFIMDPWPETGGQPPEGAPNRVIDGNTVTRTDAYWKNTDNWRNGRKTYHTDNLMVEGSYDLPMGENSLKMKLSFDRNTTRLAEEILSKYPVDYTYPNGRITQTFGEARYMANATYLLKSIAQLQAAGGAEFKIDDFGPDMDGQNELLWNDKRYVIKDETYYTFSMFGEGFYDVNEQVGIHGGLRLDMHSRAFMFNPKLAAIYSPLENHTFKVIYQSASNNGTVDNYEYNYNQVSEAGTINTEPEFQDPKLQPAAGRGIVQPAPSLKDLHSLKPEKVHSIELAYVGQFMENLTVEPSFAWGKIMDLFGWSQDLFRVVNVGQYEYVNGDLDVKYSTKKWKFGANHTYQRPVRTEPDKEAKTYYMYQLDTNEAGEYGYFAGYNQTGDSIYKGYYSKSKKVPLNVVKTQVTFDGKSFMSIPDHMTKMYCTYSPFEWLSLSTSMRLYWGLPGMAPVLDSFNDTSNNFGYYRYGVDGQSIKDYIMRSVSKKWNASVNFSLPQNFDLSIYGYNLLGSDNHSRDSKKLDRNTVNTFRKQQAFFYDQRELFSLDQRTFGVTVSKNF